MCFIRPGDVLRRTIGVEPLAHHEITLVREPFHWKEFPFIFHIIHHFPHVVWVEAFLAKQSLGIVVVVGDF